MKSNSQSLQDIFALSVCTKKTYIEIGANRPRKWNNTLLLEQNGFKGFSIEYSKKWKTHWETSDRTNKIYWDNALTFDYRLAVEENNMSASIGYLSCDIEPPQKTFDALVRVINSGIDFECITFEDDRYQSTGNYHILAEKFLAKNGYKVAVKDVTLKDTDQIFETWFVKNTVDFETVDFNTWRQNVTSKK